MSHEAFTRDDVIGVEPKHITYVMDQHGGGHDNLIVKEIVHLKDGRKIPRLNHGQWIDYERPYYVTHKGLQNHNEKKDYELVKNLQAYTCKQFELASHAAKILKDYSMGPRPRLRQLARNPYLYGADISSVALLKNDYRKRYPDLQSLNTLAGGDIETNVFKNDIDEIIMMSVSYKENVLLVYLKEWIAEHPDAIAETHAMADKLIGKLIKARNLKITVEIADTDAEVAIRCINKLHEWKPDFWGFWNMDFDMGKILACFERSGIDPKDVFADPGVPDRFKYFNYRQGPSQKVTASGKTMSLGFEDRWHWVTCPASFQSIDQMTVYRITRIANGKDSSYALDAILSKELNDEFEIKLESEEDRAKLIKRKAEFEKSHSGGFIYYYLNEEEVDDFDPATLPLGVLVEVEASYNKLKLPAVDHLKGLRWHEEMQSKYKIEYGVYNIVDSIRLEQLDEKTKDLASSISMYSKNSDYKNFNSNPKRLVDDMHFWYLNRPEPAVIGTASDQMSTELDKYVVGHDDWIITLPSYMVAPEGLNCIEEFPFYKTLIFAHVADLDIVSTYPNVSQLLNIARETCVMEMSKIQGVTEVQKREVGVDMTGGKTNAVATLQRVLGAPKLDDMLAAYLESRAKK